MAQSLGKQCDLEINPYLDILNHSNTIFHEANVHESIYHLRDREDKVEGAKGQPHTDFQFLACPTITVFIY